MGRNFERARRDSLGRARDGTNRRKIASGLQLELFSPLFMEINYVAVNSSSCSNNGSGTNRLKVPEFKEQIRGFIVDETQDYLVRFKGDIENKFTDASHHVQAVPFLAQLTAGVEQDVGLSQNELTVKDLDRIWKTVHGENGYHGRQCGV